MNEQSIIIKCDESYLSLSRVPNRVNFLCLYLFFVLFQCYFFFACFCLGLLLLGFVIYNRILLSQMRKAHEWSLASDNYYSRLRGFKERKCGNSRGQLKKKQNSQGESLFSKGRVTNLKIPGFFSKKIYLYPQPYLEVFWNSQILMKGGRKCLACNVTHQATKIKLDLTKIYITLSSVREVCKLGDVA